VLIVDTPASTLKPHYALAEDGKWWVYVRVKDKSVLASKIVVDVLKRSTGDTGVLVEYSSKEKSLLEYLDTAPRITVKEYCDLIKVGRRAAQRILVNMILSGVIRVHTSEKEEYYTAA
jgi:predicted HTH transcriptional regulator